MSGERQKAMSETRQLVTQVLPLLTSQCAGCEQSAMGSWALEGALENKSRRAVSVPGIPPSVAGEMGYID